MVYRKKSSSCQPNIMIPSSVRNKNITMKTEKLIQSFLVSGSSGRTNGIIALLAGLAAGAVLGILFAPDSGVAARKKIRDGAKGLLGGCAEEEEELASEHRQRNQGAIKRPKSDLKTLIHDAHVAATD
jgi:gas vesicle protein